MNNHIEVEMVANEVLSQYESENALDVCFKLVRDSKKKKEKEFWMKVMTNLHNKISIM